MMRRFTALLAAFAFAAATFTPAAADARDRRGGYYDGGRHHGHWRGHDHDDGDAVAAGVVGLVIGLAIGSLASQPRQPQARCSSDYRYCEPPPGYYQDRRDGYYDRRYDDRRGSAYEQEYGELEGAPYEEGSYDPAYADERQPQCTRRERQWDRYAQRYLMVDVPC